MLVLFIKVITGWLIMALITLAILLIFCQWYLDYIRKQSGCDLGKWKDSFSFFVAVVVTWPFVLIALPFRNVFEN